ncbi:MAG: hypothetical protein ACM34G_04975, partial [Acidobacteriota bacterium]
AEMRADLRRVKRDSESSIEIAISESQPRRKAAPWKLWAGIAAVILAAIVIAALLLPNRKESETARTLVQRQLTANSAEAPVYSGSISPDGKHLVYSDATGFYIRIIDTGETDPLKLPPGFCFR